MRFKKQKTPRNSTMPQSYLKKNDLVAIPFDKGVGICLMKNEQYHEKMNNIIHLPQFEKYVKPRINAKDAVIKEEERVIEKLESLLKGNHLRNCLQGDAKLYTRYMDDIFQDVACQQSDSTLVKINSIPA